MKPIGSWLAVGCLGLFAGLAEDARAAEEQTSPGQVARAGPGGVALNILGDRNIVTINPADPQVRVIVARLVTSSAQTRKRQRGQDEAIAELGRQVDDVRQAVAAVVAAARQPAADKASRDAADLLAIGDTGPAQALLRQQEFAALKAAELDGANSAAQRERAATLAIDQGALASLSDTQTAIAAYERAVRYEPDNPWNLFRLGDLLMISGHTQEALATFEKARTLAGQQRALRGRPGGYEHAMAASLLRSGDALVVLGKPDAALVRYREGLDVSSPYADAGADMTGMLRARAALYQRVGDLYVLRREWAKALREYQNSVEVRERLLKGRPTDAVIALGLSSTWQKIGDAYVQQLNHEKALTAFEQARRVALPPSDADRPLWSSNEAKILQRMGNAQIGQRKRVEAQENYAQALTIRRALVAQDPKNLEWKDDLAYTCMRMGNLQFGNREFKSALSSYQEALAISLELVKQDESNLEWKRAAALSQRKVGFAHEANGNSALAQGSLTDSMHGSEALLRSDPTNAEWRTDLAITLLRLGTITGQTAEQRAVWLRRSQDIFEGLRSKGELAGEDEQYAAAAARELDQVRDKR